MTSALRRLPRAALLELARALQSGDLKWPVTAAAISRLGLSSKPAALVAELAKFGATGSQASIVAQALFLLAEERSAGERQEARAELVWTGPELPGASTRDTVVVVRELFTRATTSVLASTYVVHQGRAVFQPLAERMAEKPDLNVRLFVHVARKHLDLRLSSQLLLEFAKRFREVEWPGANLPAVFYDPRSIDGEQGGRSSLHAKCVVVDDRYSLVTSANFTEAAQWRNIEAGVLIDDSHFAVNLRSQFDRLVADGLLVRLPV